MTHRAISNESSDADSEPAPEVVAALLAHRREFLGFLERHIGDRVLAEDLLQDAFTRLDKLAALRDDESAVAWFYRVLRNAAIDHARRHQARARGLSAFAAELAAHEDAPTPETEGALCRCVTILKDALKPEYREALERIEIEGVAVKDYAQEAGLSANHAAVRAFRARSALRRELVRSCGSCATHGCSNCSCGERAASPSAPQADDA